MKYRIATLDAAEDLGASGTKVINIILNGQISMIELKFAYTVATVSVMAASILANLSKIEIVDGGEVIVSLTGEQAFAIACYEQLETPSDNLSLKVSDVAEVSVPIYFGRYLWDAAMALRPDQFRNLQLRVTWNEATADNGATVNSFSAYAFIDDAPANGGAKGYIVNKEIYVYALAASAHEYPLLPTDKPIRRIFLHADSDLNDFDTLYSNVKLEIDGGSFVPFDIPASDIVRYIKSAYPRFHHRVRLDSAVTAKTLYDFVTKDHEIIVEYDGTAFVTASSKFAVPTFTGRKIALAASVDIKAVRALVSGYLPFGLIPWDFGDVYDPQGVLMPGTFKQARLDLLTTSSATSSSNGRVLVQTIETY